MDAGPANVAYSFSERASRVLERVEYRLARSAADKELVYRTRYVAQARQKLLPARADRRLFDEDYDASPNHHNIMILLDGEFASAVRIHVGSDENAILPSLSAFGDVLTPHLREGRVIVDASRFVAKVEYASKYPELPYVTFRAAWLAAAHFRGEIITTTCAAEQRAFFKRVFGFESLGPLRADPHTGRATVCMAADYQAEKKEAEDRLPMLRSTEAEARSVFALTLSPRLTGRANRVKAKLACA